MRARVATAALLLCGLLLGCQKQAVQTDSKQTPVTQPTATGDGRTLRIFMWSDYIDPQVVKDFEKARGVRVIIDTFESNEAMLAKLQGGGSSYDLATPSNYFIQTMVREKLLQKVRTDLLPNFANAL